MLPYLAQAWKSWKTAKTPAALAVIALAVGIGSITAIFTIINSVLLQPLPYAHSERWVMLLGASPREPDSRSSINFGDILKYQERNRSFDVFGWFEVANFNLTSPGAPQHLSGVEVTPPLINSLGVNPIQGRWFQDATTPTAVISQALWQRLGSDPAIIGKPITLNGRSYSVIGIMPSWFRFPMAGPYGEVKADVWLPLDPRGAPRGRSPYFAYARLKPGVTRQQADADMKRMAADIVREDAPGHPDYTAAADGLLDLYTKEIRPTLMLLFAAAGLLLLITCANVAGLLLARSVVRARETAIRVALGASRSQLAFQYFLEGLVVSITAAAGALGVSVLLVRGVLPLTSDLIPRADQIALDWKVLLFTLGVALAANTLCGLAPLWQAVRTPPNEVLTDGVRVSAGARSGGLTRALVIAEIALAFMLLSGCAVLLTQLRNLIGVSPGFDPNNLLSFQLTLPDPIADDNSRRAPYQQRLIQALESIPGVSSAAIVNQLVLGGCCYVISVYPQDRQPNFRVEKTSYMVVSPSYFRTLGQPVKQGRLFTESDRSHDPFSIVINESAAKLYWPDRNAVGASGRFGPDEKASRFQVIGVVADVRNDGLGKPVVPEVYLSASVPPLRVSPLYFLVRSPLASATLINEVTKAIHTVDPLQPIHDANPIASVVRSSTTLQRLGAFTMAFFAFAALLMATLGVYGVVSYSMRQRTVEIGTRMALGALPSDLLRLIVGSGLKMALIGLAIGGVAMIATSPYLLRVFPITDVGPLPVALSTLLVAIIAGFASFFPAWRATLLSPMVAIRSESGLALHSPRRRTKDEGEVIEGSPLADFIDASRRSASHRDAMRATLVSMCGRIGAQWATLLEYGSQFHSTVSTRDDTSFTAPPDGYLINRLRFHSAALPFTKPDFELLRRWASEYRPELLPEIEAFERTGTSLALPLRTTREMLGVLLIGPSLKGEMFHAAAKRAVDESAGQLALMVENGRLTGRIVEQEKLQRDLHLAAEVQRRLLPQRVPESSAASFATLSMPARSIGGDYYDFIPLADHTIGIAIADVAGKGIAAALIMSLVQASLRLTAEGAPTLAQLTARMNRFLKQSAGSNRTSYATFFCAAFEEQTRRLRYINAGHNPPLLLRAATGAIEELHTGDRVIGMFPQATYHEAAVDLQAGDVLLAFTDGVTEAMNPAGEEFSVERLRTLLPQLLKCPADEAAALLKRELEAWIQDAVQHDDITFIVTKVK